MPAARSLNGVGILAEREVSRKGVRKFTHVRVDCACFRFNFHYRASALLLQVFLTNALRRRNEQDGSGIN